jgi:hypothetical protein
VLAQREYYAIPRVEMQHPSSRASLRKIDAEQKGSSLLRGDKSMEIRMRSRCWPLRGMPCLAEVPDGGSDEGAG